MTPRFFDPIGRECSAATFQEWLKRPELKLVRLYEGDNIQVRLLWRDEPIDAFMEPEVFRIEVRRKTPGAVGGWAIDSVASVPCGRKLIDAIEKYQQVLIDNGLAKKDSDGYVEEIDNQAAPTDHELDFAGFGFEEMEEDESTMSLECPAITPERREVETLRTDKVGTGFAGLADGSDAW